MIKVGDGFRLHPEMTITADQTGNDHDSVHLSMYEKKMHSVTMTLSELKMK